jgi:hypothetical protein
LNDLKVLFPYPELLRELRNGRLWHCTSPRELRQIWHDGFIRPNDGRVKKWGDMPCACHQLGAVSLFDFTTQPEERLLESVSDWKPFLRCDPLMTAVIGLEKTLLPARLVHYPENKESTTGNAIPWVEVCHCGPIPVSAIVHYLLVCACNHNNFRSSPVLDEKTLAAMHEVCAKAASHPPQVFRAAVNGPNVDIGISEPVRRRTAALLVQMREEKRKKQAHAFPN